MGKRSYEEQERVYNFLQALQQQPELLREFARGLKLLAAQADQEQPIGEALNAEIQAAAAEVEAVALESESWYGMCRSDAGNRRDEDRVKSPTKGPGPEARGNVGAAIRDV